MGFLSTVKDFFEIRKSRVEAKKAQLEVRRLEAEARMIKEPTAEEIRAYDRKTQDLLRRVAPARLPPWIPVLLWLFALGALVGSGLLIKFYVL
jgi:hypothetical protein